MSETTWFRTLTRPVGHLVGTIVCTALLVASAVLASFYPQWQPALVLIGSIPLIIWATIMSVIFYRANTEPPPDQM